MNDDTKIMVLLLVGIVAGMIMLTAFNMHLAQVCSGFPNYTEKGINNPDKYNPDPEKQLEIWKEEFGNSWASGYYDEESDTLHVCKYKDIEP